MTTSLEETRQRGAIPLHEAGEGGPTKSGRVRCGRLLYGCKMRQWPAGTRCCWSPQRPRLLLDRAITSRTSPGFAARNHPLQLRGEGFAPHRRFLFYTRLALLAGVLSLFGTPAPACTLKGNDFTLKVAAGSLLAFEGDSLTYGYDNTPTGQQPALNGSELLRSKSPFPEGVAAEANGALAVENRGFPGDRTTEALQRWANVRPARVVFIQYGTNDYGNYGGFPSGALALEDFSKNLKALVERRKAPGEDVVVILPPPLMNVDDDKRLDAYRCAAQVVARAEKVAVFNPAAVLAPSNGNWVDGVHLSVEANGLIAKAIRQRIVIESAKPKP